MSQEEQNQENEAAAVLPAPARSKKTLIAASGVGALLLITGVPAGYYMLTKEKPKVEEVSVDVTSDEESVAKLEGSQETVELEEGEEALGAIVPLDTFLLNLSEGKYIRVQMQLEFEGLDVPPKFYSRLVPIRDAIITYLTAQSPEDLQTGKGKDDLRSGLRKIVNDQLRKEDVRRVYFTQFVIQ